MKLFLDIVLFLVLAMVLGIAIGFLSWRWRRFSVTAEEWEQQQRQLEARTQRSDELSARLQESTDAAHQHAEEARRWREMFENTRVDRDHVAGLVEMTRRESLEARHQRDQLAQELAAVQRRLKELSVYLARGQLGAVRHGEQPMALPPSHEHPGQFRDSGQRAGDEPQARAPGSVPLDAPPTSIERPPRPAAWDPGDPRAPGVAG